MKILLLSNKTKYLEEKKIFGTENIVKVICDEMNKLGINIETLELKKNKNLYCKDKENLINYYSRGKFTDSSNFKALLREIKPDLVQFHGFTKELGYSYLLACKEYSIKTLLWHNVPSITCMQHQLLYMSKEPCDGKFSIKKCTSCALQTYQCKRITIEESAEAREIRLQDIESSRLF